MAANEPNLIAWEPDDDSDADASGAPVAAPVVVRKTSAQERKEEDMEIAKMQENMASFAPPNLPVVEDPAPVPPGDADMALLQAAAAKRAARLGESATPAAPTPVPVPKTPLEEAVSEAIVSSGIMLADPDMEKRLRMLVSLYFRDLRDALETSSKLTMPAQSGGMGFSDADAGRAMALFTEKRLAFHSGSFAKAKDDKERFVAERSAHEMASSQRAEAADRASLDKVYSDVTGKAVAAPPVPSVPPAPPRTIPVVAERSQTAVVAVAPASVPAPVSAPMPAIIPPAPKPVPPPPVILAPAVVVPPVQVPQPAPAFSPVPAPTPAPIAPLAKPTMSDVSAAPHLVGPVEELRAITLKDLRRLSRDPKEALLKLRDKIDLLAEQSFDKKTQGTKAWQESEVNKAYLALLRGSLEGRPVLDLIAEKEAKGEVTLTKAEFDAVMEFNRSLRFG